MGDSPDEWQQDLASAAGGLRRFHRFFMYKMRPLRDVMRGPGMHASYLRVLRELGEAPEGTFAATIAWRLQMNGGLVCRILGWFRALGYLEESPDPRDGRRKVVKLSPLGRHDYMYNQRRVTDTAAFMLCMVETGERDRLVAAMTTIEGILRNVRWDDIQDLAPQPPPFVSRR